jgi:hypothetical protein
MSPLSRHRDGVDLHYGRDDFASQDRLVRTLSRDRAKDMASDYERADPAQNYAERRGITFRERVAEIVRKVVPERVRNMFDGLRPSAEAVPGTDSARRPQREAPERKVVEDPEGALRKGPHEGSHPSCPSRECDLRYAGPGRQGQPGAGEGIAGGPQGLRGGAALLARTTPKLPTRKTRNSPLKPLRATLPAPSARSSSKPNCAPIRAAAPTVS